MVRDAAYDSLLRSRRRSLHARIAEVIERQFSEAAEQQPDFIAHPDYEGSVISVRGRAEICVALGDDRGNEAASKGPDPHSLSS